jgi:hypothetical protein
VSANFDPYHAWLGIPRGSRPLNHYQLLGLKPFTSEPPVIAEAVETQKAKVQPHTTAGAGEAARLVLVELDNARKVLLNAASRKAYDVQLRKQMGLPEPAAAKPVAAPRPAAAAAAVSRPATAAPATAIAGTPVAVMPQTVAPQMAMPVAGMPVAPVQPMPVAGYAQPMAAVPMAAVMPVAPAGVMPMAAGAPVLGSAAVDPNSGAPMFRSGVKPVKRRKSGASAAVFILAGAILVLSGALTFAFRNELSAKLDEMLGSSPQQVAQAPSASPTKRIAVRTAPIGTDGSGNRHYEDVVEKSPTMEPEKNEMAAKIGTGLGNAFSETAPSIGMPKGPGTGKPKGKKPAKNNNMPSNNSSSGMLGNADPSFATPLPTNPASPEEKQAVATTLAAARKALGERKIEDARIQLDLARLEASSGESLKAVERTRLLADAVEQFWNAVREGMKGLKAADELKAGPSVESSESKVAVRIDGKNREYAFDKLPRGLARSIAERWLATDDPNSKLIMAAFLAVDPNGDLEQAHKLVQTASNEGAGLEDLKAEIAAIQR